MHYGQDSKMLLQDPVEDTLLQFEKPLASGAAA
jgi:hypothetical protein